MTDISQPSNQDMATAQGKKGMGKVWSTILAAMITTYIMNQFSLHGVNFELDIGGVKISSELVKSTIDGTLTGFFTWITPSHFLAWLCDVKVSCRKAWKQFREA